MFLEEGIGESRQPSAQRIGSGWSAQLSSSDPRTARRGSDASVLSASHPALCEQPHRIRPPIGQAPAASDAGAAKHTRCNTSLRRVLRSNEGRKEKTNEPDNKLGSFDLG